MKMRSGRSSCRSHGADFGSGRDLVTDGDADDALVGVVGLQAVGMIDYDQVAEAASRAGERNNAL